MLASYNIWILCRFRSTLVLATISIAVKGGDFLAVILIGSESFATPAHADSAKIRGIY